MDEQIKSFLLGINKRQVEESGLPYDTTGRWLEPCRKCHGPMWIGKNLVQQEKEMGKPIICSACVLEHASELGFDLKDVSIIPLDQPEVICQTCKVEIGELRMDNGLSCGIHCDECFKKMVQDARKQSW